MMVRSTGLTLHWVSKVRRKIDTETDVTGDAERFITKIVLAHLREFPDYYTGLEKFEAETEDFWRTYK